MAGVARTVIGVLLLVIGLLFVLTIFGLLLGIVLVILGIILVVSGSSARRDTERMESQQQQTNLLLQQQLQLTAMQSNQGVAAPPSYAATGTTQSTIAPGAEKFCPFCGQSNQRGAGFCLRCGKPLPPPP